ncbi:VanW family protein [Anaerobacillus sp. MEB173]|uniref:VanW family protein n=1 Tax=Anaerobacillus sp. MEB173 TaxID=3383345 RepID=UPI003F92B435
MKRTVRVVLFLMSIVLLMGCQISKESMLVSKMNPDFQSKLKEIEKVPISLDIHLVDDRVGEVIASVNLKELGYGEEEAESLDEESVSLLAKSLAEGIDQPMKNPTIDLEGNIIEGQNRIILSEQELVEKLMTLSYYNKELILPIYETPPTVSADQLIDILEVPIGNYTTYFNPNVQGRSMNIKLSSEAIQHFVLGPGDEFSFNGVVGQRTRERGYQEAKEIVNKEFVIGIGGGICQTSSTLFNAIDLAGLEVVERYTHSREIGYVPVSRDATVSWGGPDFKFKNPYDFPIIIKTDVSLQGGRIDVAVYTSQQNALVARGN